MEPIELPEEVTMPLAFILADAEQMSIMVNEIAQAHSMTIGTVSGHVLHPMFEISAYMVYTVVPNEDNTGVVDSVNIILTISQNDKDDLDVVHHEYYRAPKGQSQFRMHEYMKAIMIQCVVEDFMGINVEQYKTGSEEDYSGAAWN